VVRHLFQGVSSADVIDLRVDRPAVGGRMIARHQGKIVLVGGAIPGERVQAVIEGVRRDVVFARAVDILESSPDRRSRIVRPSCGGRSFAHIAYARQLALKSEIVKDAFRRIGRINLDRLPPVTPSLETGYRMRARLHVVDTKIGFLDERSHRVCDVVGTGQLFAKTEDLIGSLGAKGKTLAEVGARAVELAEDLAGDQCALHVLVKEAHGWADEVLRDLAASLPGVTGLSVASDMAAALPRRLLGTPYVSDTVGAFLPSSDAGAITLRRHAGSFFQANRYLVPELVQAVAALVEGEELVDLYAGVGLFSVSVASMHTGSVVAVERDPTSGSDLATNGAPFASRLCIVRATVETYLKRCGSLTRATVIVDPPRTGLSRECVARLARRRPQRIIYVSCDVATQARDLRALGASGYRVCEVRVFDMFPNTPHVETVVALERMLGGEDRSVPEPLTDWKHPAGHNVRVLG